ncbi:uracil phosphoribosyltransferase [Endozoicomonas sp. 4G]|uniref:uracil phosphoribosyltransferase n=1 Tax=Endozoicomonas sp. 4G TaxID=2872754 RepID=UPI0020789913|nr:uracil phosphoribosyltransferase [Endozoicomonas sp. 4G]
MKTLNAQSRSIEIHGNELAEVHREIGKVLGQKYLDKLPLQEITVTNPQGKEGGDLALDCSNVTLVCLLRAGLYLAEGVRQLFGKSAHLYVLSEKPDDLKPQLIKGRDVVLVDSVIDSGKTLMGYISACSEAASVTSIAVVMQDGFKAVIDEKYPELDFIVSRTSTNSYVGEGQTDTGNRLFGTC